MSSTSPWNELLTNPSSSTARARTSPTVSGTFSTSTVISPVRMIDRSGSLLLPEVGRVAFDEGLPGRHVSARCATGGIGRYGHLLGLEAQAGLLAGGQDEHDGGEEDQEGGT